MDGVDQPEDVLESFDEDEYQGFPKGFAALFSLRLHIGGLETNDVAGIEVQSGQISEIG